MTESIFNVNFVDNKIVGFDEKATAGQRQNNNQSVTCTVCFIKTESNFVYSVEFQMFSFNFDGKNITSSQWEDRWCDVDGVICL